MFTTRKACGVTEKELAQLVMERRALDVLRPLLPPGEYTEHAVELNAMIRRGREELGL